MTKWDLGMTPGGNPAGFPPPKGDPQTVLRNYMHEHNCSETDAKAALEQMYGRPPMPPMPGLTPNGAVDMTYCQVPTQQTHAVAGTTASGAIDFSYQPAQKISISKAPQEYSSSGMPKYMGLNGDNFSMTWDYTSFLGKMFGSSMSIMPNLEGLSKSAKKAVKKEYKAYQKEFKHYVKEYMKQHRAEYKELCKTFKNLEKAERKNKEIEAYVNIESQAYELAEERFRQAHPDIENLDELVGRYRELQYYSVVGGSDQFNPARLKLKGLYQ